MRQWFSCSVLVVLGTVLTACQSDQSRTSSSTAVDSAGVTIVSSTAVDDSLPWSFDLIAEIGGADSGAQAFDKVTPYNVATDGQGVIAVLDRDNGNRIVLFDSMGKHLRTVGARGAGPGETEFPVGISLDARGMLATLDNAKASIVRWDANGAPLPELKEFAQRGSVSGRAVVRGDTVIVVVEQFDSLRTTRFIERWTPRDSLRHDSVSFPRPKMVLYKCIGLAIPPMFSGEFVLAERDGLVAATRQTRYEIDVYRDGRRVRSVRRAIAPVATTMDDVRKLYPEDFKVRFGEGRECVTPASEVAEKAGMAPTRPVLGMMSFAPDGSLWVERYHLEGEVPSVDVFDADGNYSGTLTGRALPLGFLGRDLVLFAVDDEEEGTSRIGVYRIRR
jgi:hypothetical protein